MTFGKLGRSLRELFRQADECAGRFPFWFPLWVGGVRFQVCVDGDDGCDVLDPASGVFFLPFGGGYMCARVLRRTTFWRFPLCSIISFVIYKLPCTRKWGVGQGDWVGHHHDFYLSLDLVLFPPHCIFFPAQMESAHRCLFPFRVRK